VTLYIRKKQAQKEAEEKEKEKLRILQDGLPFFSPEELRYACFARDRFLIHSFLFFWGNRRYDGSDPTLPIYLAISGRVLDVTSSSKFYARG
jgi:hypothetical protein